jgi:hypothetical protein
LRAYIKARFRGLYSRFSDHKIHVSNVSVTSYWCAECKENCRENLRKSGSCTSKGNVTTLYTPPTHVTAVATYASLAYPLAALSFEQLHVLDRALAAAGFTHHNLRLADCLPGQHLVCLVAFLQPHATTLSLFSNRI